MLLVIDIGNSNIVFGVYVQDKWILEYRMPTDIKNDIERKEYWNKLIYAIGKEKPKTVANVAISSVVPSLTDTIARLVQLYFNIKPLIIGPTLYDNLSVTIANKEEIGTDLVANAVAAQHYYKKPKIVIDFGTALTFTTIAADGEILGVAIAPGIKTAMNSLFQNAAQLPKVPIEVPTSAIGKNTFHALQAGVLLGYIGLVNSLIEEIESELNITCIIIATGGLSHVLKDKITRFDVINPKLTLDGIRIIFEQSQIL